MKTKITLRNSFAFLWLSSPILVGLLLFSASPLPAQSPGELDLSFETGSMVNDTVRDVAPGDNGTVYIAGDFTSVPGATRSGIARLHADGTADTSFDPGSGADSTVESMEVQSDGKVLIGGEFTSYDGVPRNRIARLNADGSLDTGFDPGSGANDTVNSVVVQSDGKVLIGGEFTSYNGEARNRIARLNADGSLDTAFDPGSGADFTVFSMAVQSDGKVFVAGGFSHYDGVPRNRIARLNADGSLDTGFDPGSGADSWVNSVALQADGKLLIVGRFISYNGVPRNRIARLNADGTLDSGFDPGPVDSWTGNNEVKSVAVQPDGKVLIGGSFTFFAGQFRNRIARLNADGTLDAGFDPGSGASRGIFSATVHSMMVQSDGKVFIGGAFANYDGVPRNRLARLNEDGSLDTGFDPGSGANDTVNSVVVQPDGKVLIGGSFTSYNGGARRKIARLNEDGTLDTGFDPGGGESGTVNSVAVQPDGKVLIGGGFMWYGGEANHRLARLNADGSIDTGFGPGSGANDTVNSVAVQSDGKVLIGGAFTSYDGVPRSRLARLNVDGTLDTGFDPGSGRVNSVAVQSDGKVLIGGALGLIARLNADGSLDTGFDSGSGASSKVSSVVVQLDGKVLIGGWFTSYDGVPRNRIARLNADGSLDTGFDPGSGANGTVRSVAEQPDGKVVIGGSFTSYDGVACNGLARLNADGTLDTRFDPGSGANDTVHSVAVQADGKVLIGGGFDGYDGVARSFLARIHNPSAPPESIRIDTVFVGDAGNANDSTGFGGVNYDYHIGTHEVTNAQYAAFLNGVAKTDPHGLYNSKMGSESEGGITRGGTSGNFSYSIKSGFANKPVNFVSFWDAARFSNWLTNGQGNGDTETGVYKLTATGISNNNITRDLTAWNNGGVAIASEDEWYKAAYYDPTLNDGSGGYYTYPTQSNTPPDAANPNDIDANSANFDSAVGTFPGNLTEVGSYTLAESHYGTFDQGGNVFEWNDAIIGLADDSRVVRGGSFNSIADTLLSIARLDGDPVFTEDNFLGFRVSSLQPLAGPANERERFDADITDAGLIGVDAEPDATPFGDGVENLLKYAFNMNLAGPDNHILTPGGSSGLPSAGLIEEEGQSYWRVEYVRRKDSDLTYTPQKSGTLGEGNFTALTAEETVSDIPGEPEWERVVIDEPFNSATEDRGFTRVRVDGL